MLLKSIVLDSECSEKCIGVNVLFFQFYEQLFFYQKNFTFCLLREVIFWYFCSFFYKKKKVSETVIFTKYRFLLF